MHVQVVPPRPITGVLTLLNDKIKTILDAEIAKGIECYAYAGVGSRETPLEVLESMQEIAVYLDKAGMVLRSGGADGADLAFERKVPAMHKEIFLPWKSFNNNASNLFYVPPEAFTLAERYHPGWKYLKQGAQKLMARNVQQILGQLLDSPSKFVICWTQDGADGVNIKTSSKTGGTGQSIRIAADHGIPVYNLKTIL